MIHTSRSEPLRKKKDKDKQRFNQLNCMCTMHYFVQLHWSARASPPNRLHDRDTKIFLVCACVPLNTISLKKLPFLANIENKSLTVISVGITWWAVRWKATVIKPRITVLQIWHHQDVRICNSTTSYFVFFIWTTYQQTRKPSALFKFYFIWPTA